MKYCQIYRTAEPKVIGIKTGTSQVEIMENEIEKNQNYIDFKNHFSGYNKDFWYSQDKVFKLKPPIIKGKLRQNAKITDIMRYGQVYQFLFEMYSEKYIDIIKVFNIGKHKIFDFEIDSIKQKYYLLFIESISTPEIIFDKSLIYTGHKILKNIKYYPIKTYQEFQILLETQPLATYEKIVISKKHFGKDIISIQSTGGHFYSERLIDILLDSGITGLQVSYNNSIQLEFV